ncbi:MAG: extracellular solute-binding protein [Parvibaculaceae bacterium]|nr:extracellular solute-binding protein [Parvibaculaceae bacterium]
MSIRKANRSLAIIRHYGCLLLLLPMVVLMAGTRPARAMPEPAIAMYGQPLYPPGFTHFNYVNPDAPQGGTLKLSAIGTFDSLNSFIVNGTPVVGLRDFVFESLMARSYDEPFSLYGLLADSIDVPDDRSSVTFHLRDGARFSDGQPVTVDDVIFSLEILRDKGRPNYRTYYSKVVKIERPDARSVRFVFARETGGRSAENREMPLILGLMPILPKHVYAHRAFDKTSFDVPVGSGPYVVESFSPGQRITYRKSPDYWGKDMAVNTGRYNPERVVFDYFRDTNGAFEAFKAGLYDARLETDPTRWTTGYDFPAVREGKVRKVTFPTSLPSGMYGLVFNTRKPVFADIRVRQALTALFDFEWINKTLYNGIYVRTRSYFDGSALSSCGRAASEAERAILAPFPDAVPAAIMEKGYQPPSSDGSGFNRPGRAEADRLLRSAGYEIRDGLWTRTKTGEPLSFEILVTTPTDERLALVYAGMAARSGVHIQVRNVDASQYQQRLDTYGFDMIFYNWDLSLSPGNEQAFYWGSAAADTSGSRNYMGIRSPAVDAAIAAMLAATTQDQFIPAVRAMDRALLAGNYVIPLFHPDRQWGALWNRVGFPARSSLYGYRLDTWWVVPQP